MRGTTHFLAGAAAGLYYCNTLPDTDVKRIALITGVSAVCALLPDVDVRGSKASKSIGNNLTGVIRLFTAHRGFFHSPLCYVIAALIVRYFYPDQMIFIIAGFIGAMTHIFLDMWTNQGVPLFFPYPKKVSLADIKSGGGIDAMLSVILLVVCVFFAGKKAGLLDAIPFFKSIK